MNKSLFTDVTKLKIKEVPCYLVVPKTDEIKGTIIFYHGWASNASNQIFRANIFANYGYEVIIPEARYHGERGELNYEDEKEFKEYFFRIIMHNIEEFPEIYKFAKERNTKQIILAGHSMGAITAGGLFTLKTDINQALLFNGCMNWGFLIEATFKNDKKLSYEQMRTNDFIIQMDPKLNMKNLVDRKLIMYNGADDEIINPNVQEEFYKELVELYSDRDKLIFEKWEATSHQVTTQMLDKAIEVMN